MMSPASPIRVLVDRKYLVYVGGLGMIAGGQITPMPGAARSALASLALGVMVLTYAGERWQRAENGVERPLSFLIGLAGVVGGAALVGAGRIGGIGFLAGGLWFLSRSFGAGGDRA